MTYAIRVHALPNGNIQEESEYIRHNAKHGISLTLQRLTATVIFSIFSSYRAENTLGLGYKTQSVQAEEK